MRDDGTWTRAPGQCLSCNRQRLGRGHVEWMDDSNNNNDDEYAICVSRLLLTTSLSSDETPALSVREGAITAEGVESNAEMSPGVDGGVANNGSSGIRLSVTGFWIIVSLVILCVVGLVLRQIK